MMRNGFWRLVGCLATDLAVFCTSVRVNPRGHRSRVGPGIGDDEAFPLRQLLGVQRLCWAYRFGVELPSRFTLGILGCVFAKELTADRYRRLVAGRWLDALLSDEAVSKAFHRRCRWIRSCAIAPCAAKQRRSPRSSPLLQLADNALGDIAYGVNRADHLLFAYNDVVEQALKLRRHAGID